MIRVTRGADPGDRMLTESIQIVDDYWAADFGCAPEDLRPSAPRVRRHAGGLADYTGVLILVLEAAPLISVPADLHTAISARANELVATAVCDSASLIRLLLPATITKVIGPALLNYADHSCFLPVELKQTRELSADDAGAFLDLKAACSDEDWEAKGLALDATPTFGAFSADGRLMALATFRVWAERIAHLLVVARPECRSQGFGTRAVAAAAERALELGLLPQYRALEDNVASRRVAHKLGFQAYGYTIAARLAPA